MPRWLPSGVPRPCGVFWLLLAGCSPRPTSYTQPVQDPGLSALELTPSALDFGCSEPPIVEPQFLPLLRHFEGVTTEHCPPEVGQEVVAWFNAQPVEVRRDKTIRLPSGFMRGFESAHTWIPGSTGGSWFRYFEIAGQTLCVGQVNGQLGWISTADLARTVPIEHDRSLREYEHWQRFGLAHVGDELLLVHDGARGLLEIAFPISQARLGTPRTRALGRPRGMCPRLLQVGSGALLLWSELVPESSRTFTGGLALRVARRSPSDADWSPPATLTVDLRSPLGVVAACAGERVLVAWSDDRFEVQEGWMQLRGGKLFAALSTDAGATWSLPACLEDPESRRSAFDRPLFALGHGERWLITGSTSLEDGPVPDTVVLSADLARIGVLPGSRLEPLRALCSDWIRTRDEARPR